MVFNLCLCARSYCFNNLVCEILNENLFQEDKVRRRNDWMKWIPSSSRNPSDSGLQSSSAPSPDVLTKSFQKMTVEEMTPDQHSMTLKPSPSPEDAQTSLSELTSQSQISQGEGIDNAS